MDGFILSAILIAATIFLITILRSFAQKAVSDIFIDADSNIETRLRLIIRKNPSAEIFVIDKTNSTEISKILTLMKRDFPNINIISAQ